MPPSLRRGTPRNLRAAEPGRRTRRWIQSGKAWPCKLPLAFGLCGHGVEFRHVGEQPVERIGDDLLRRTPADGTGEAQLQMPRRVEPERKRGFALGTRRRAWRRRS